MAEIGLTAYRFSIAWPRVIPDGRGKINVEGLDFYDRLVDDLLRHDIEPFATLYHWELPQLLEDRGGWYSRDTTDAFQAYTEAVVHRLADRVTNWVTVNEPWVQAWFGYGEGKHAPGRADGVPGAVTAGHHLLLAHGKAVQVIRSLAPDSSVGITLDFWPAYPATDSVDDLKAARKLDCQKNRWFLDPVMRRGYPEGAGEHIQLLPDGFEADLETIASPTDFLGANYYSRGVVSAGPSSEGANVLNIERQTRTDLGWEVFPEGLRDLLRRLSEEYEIGRLYVTENGAAYADGPQPGTRAIRDTRRVEYLHAHFQAAAEAISSGTVLEGYFVWSLLDNFEWAEGYDDKARFGIVYVDYETQERILKDSATWYSSLIAEHRALHSTGERS